MTKHAETCPYHWYERNPCNPWFNRETRKVDLPDTLVHPKNFVMTREELTAYAALLAEMHTLIEGKATATKRARLALDKGVEGQWLYNDNGPRVVTLADAMQMMVDVAKVKLKLMQMFVDMGQRRRDETVHSSEPGAVLGEAQGVVAGDGDGDRGAGSEGGNEPTHPQRVD